MTLLNLRQQDRLCIPGEELFAADGGYSAGHGCYEIHGKIRSALAGVVQLTSTKRANGDEQKIVSVSGRFDEKKFILPTNGCIVTARVESLCLRYAKCSIICIGNTHLMDEFSATLRKEDVREVDKDSVELYKCVQPGDLLLARVIGVGDTQTSFLLSIAENQLGVKFAIGQNGERMLPDTLAAVKDKNSETPPHKSRFMTLDLMHPPFCSPLQQEDVSFVCQMDEDSDRPSTSSAPPPVEEPTINLQIPPLLEQAVEEPTDDGPSDEDASGSEDEQEFARANPFVRLLNSKAEAERSPNWRSSVLFGGRVHPDDLPADCPRPQLPDGSIDPRLHAVVENLLLPDGTLRTHNAARFHVARPIPPPAAPAVQQPSHGYVTGKNGLKWVRKKPADPPLDRTDAPPPPKRRSVNQSLVIAGGKRIDQTSNECIPFAQSGVCLAGALCAFDHDGNQMLGLCPNGADCPNGKHGLESHQMPVCDYFLRCLCSEEKCSFLHVKHQDSLENCPAFQRGVCLSGVKCSKPHRFNAVRVQQKCATAAKSLAANGSQTTNGTTADPTDTNGEATTSEEPQLATWFF